MRAEKKAERYATRTYENHLRMVNSLDHLENPSNHAELELTGELRGKLAPPLLEWGEGREN